MKTKSTTWGAALSFLLVCIVVSTFWFNKAMAEPVKNAPFQAIVKVNTYTLDKYDNLSIFSSGSGIIFDASGLVLTNYHVTTIEEEFDNSQKETSFQICLTQDPNVEPNCNWVGQLVAKDKDLDVAILQIKKTSSDGTVMEEFPYLDLDQLNASATNDTIAVLGYPAIGDETVTITEGIISGKVNKYNQDWIKTDAVTSFGSSGGAAINQYGYVIGLISRAHADLLGSLGYLINISSLRDWIETHRAQVSQPASFEDRISTLSAKQKALKETDVYQNDKPSFSITKPSDWDFDYQNENSIMVHEKNDDQGGIVNVTVSRFPIPMSTDFIMTGVKKQLLEAGILSLLNVNKDEDLVINGLTGKKITISIMGDTQSIYYFVLDNYFLEIAYDYGYAEKDKAVIDEIINSLRGVPGQMTAPLVQYENDNPKFYLQSNDSWPILELNSKEEAAEMYNINRPRAYISASVAMLEGSQKDFSNDDYLTYVKSIIDTVNSAGAMLDINLEIEESNAHYPLNDELTDAIMVSLQMTKPSTGEILGMSKEYYVREGDYYIELSVSMFTDDVADFQDTVAEAEPILASLSLLEFQKLADASSDTTGDGEVIVDGDGNNNVFVDTLSGWFDQVKNNKIILFSSLFGLIIIILGVVFIKKRGKNKSNDLESTDPISQEAIKPEVNVSVDDPNNQSQ